MILCDKDFKFSLEWQFNLWDNFNEWMTLMCRLSLLISNPSISILIARARTTNRLWGTFPLTMIGEEKVPHLAPWQRATALSGLMNYIDTQAILMTPSIYPSPPLLPLPLSQPLALLLHPPTVQRSLVEFAHTQTGCHYKCVCCSRWE